ncbi:hypothetical protein [Gilvimarinus chinensis]|uniref:hypothetical protein n=1 Tax=Gilvimarinus chinensis TaxID=396005 RepID=UPI00037521B2|nr:hypothetical protein [Gilvimarinus chinensis]
MKEQDYWPKRLSSTNYAKRWDADLTAETVNNRIKSGKLPGGRDEGGRYFVWVHQDLSPAWDYEGPIFAPSQEPSAGEQLADNIIGNMRKAG